MWHVNIASEHFEARIQIIVLNIGGPGIMVDANDRNFKLLAFLEVLLVEIRLWRCFIEMLPHRTHDFYFFDQRFDVAVGFRLANFVFVLVVRHVKPLQILAHLDFVPLLEILLHQLQL